MTRKHTKRKVWARENPIVVAFSNARRASTVPEVVTYSAMTHASMKALVEGAATKVDLQHIVMANNLTAAFMKQGFGEPHAPDMDAAANALDSLARRAKEKGRVLATGPELNALNFMLRLHDAMLDTVSVAEYNAAIKYVDKVYLSGKSEFLDLGALA